MNILALHIYLSLSIYLPISVADPVTLVSPLPLSIMGQFIFLCSSLPKILCMPVPSFGSLHILICLVLLFFLFLSFLRTLSSNSSSSVSLSLPNSHCGCFIPLVPSSISISPSCALSLHFIYAHQSITFLLYLIPPPSIYYFYSLITSLFP